VRPVADGHDRDRARCTVQQPLRGAPWQNPSQPAGVARADHDDAGPLLFRGRLQSMGGRRIRYQRPQDDIADVIEFDRETRKRALSVLSQECLVFLGAGAQRLQPVRHGQGDRSAGREGEGASERYGVFRAFRAVDTDEDLRHEPCLALHSTAGTLIRAGVWPPDRSGGPLEASWQRPIAAHIGSKLQLRSLSTPRGGRCRATSDRAR
jgi:hypothetical protein